MNLKQIGVPDIFLHTRISNDIINYEKALKGKQYLVFGNALRGIQKTISFLEECLKNGVSCSFYMGDSNFEYCNEKVFVFAGFNKLNYSLDFAKVVHKLFLRRKTLILISDTVANVEKALAENKYILEAFEYIEV